MVNVHHLEKVLQKLTHVIYANYELANEHTFSLVCGNISTGCK
jgi:O-acetyl-ADP-ribose deacetylase (regulator of RNase III)